MEAQRIHLIGIAGSGLSAIAGLLLDLGWQVSGSDRELNALARGLQARGAVVYAGHRAGQEAGADLVLRSSAVTEENVEVQSALAAGIPVLKRGEFVGRLLDGRRGIAVAGAHGKTTTTAMIAWMLTALERDPSYLIGGTPVNLSANAHAGQGAEFVIEADEYDRMFLGLRPQIAVVTNVDHDHVDCYPTAGEYTQAFVDFVAQILPGGLLVACLDDPGARQLAELRRQNGQRLLGVGLDGQAGRPPGGPPLDLAAANLAANDRGGLSFDLLSRLPAAPQPLRCHLQAPGVHNVLNALAALAVAAELGLPLAGAARSLGDFRGVGQRFEIRGEPRGITLVDDYGHHPSEIQAILAAARLRYPGRRLWAVWQPHTYSRTRALLEKFGASFENADQVLVLDIYAAREPAPQDGFSARTVLSRWGGPSQARYAGSLDSAETLLLAELRSGDVVIVFSAGSAVQLNGRLLAALQARSEAG